MANACVCDAIMATVNVLTPGVTNRSFVVENDNILGPSSILNSTPHCASSAGIAMIFRRDFFVPLVEQVITILFVDFPAGGGSRPFCIKPLHLGAVLLGDVFPFGEGTCAGAGLGAGGACLGGAVG